MIQLLTIHSDGSAQYHDKMWIGAYAFTVEYKDKTIYQKSCNVVPANNNLCELLAAIDGINHVVNKYDMEDVGTILLLTDSNYVLKGMSGENKVKTNKEAWEYMRALEDKYDIKVEHVAAHVESGNKHVDSLAKTKLRQYILEHSF